MANRLQLQQTAPSHALPSLRSQTGQEEQPTIQIPTVLLAAHPIEPELLGQRPRFIKTPPAYLSLHRYIFPVCMVIPQSVLFTRKHPDLAWMAIATFLAIITIPSVLAIFLKRLERGKEEMLRYGIPSRAIVEDVSDAASFVDGSFTLNYWYQNAQGCLTRITRKIPNRSIEGRDIAPGDTFTVLLSPFDEKEVLPYFLAAPFTVVPIHATAVSRDVSARIASQTAQSVSQRFGLLGAIEPELQGIGPRRVSFRQRIVRFNSWVVAAVALYSSVIALLWATITAQSNYTIAAALTGFLLFSVVHGIWEHLSEEYFLLRLGVATRAVITEEKVTSVSERLALQDQAIAFLYEFEGPDGSKRSSTFCLKRLRAAQFGLEKGAALTVIYNSITPSKNRPYLDFNYAEVRGKTPPIITSL